MGSHALDEELIRHLATLAPDQKLQILDFARALGTRKPKGTPGWRLAEFKAKIPFDDLDRMTAEIESGCEQVHSDEW